MQDDMKADSPLPALTAAHKLDAILQFRRLEHHMASYAHNSKGKLVPILPECVVCDPSEGWPCETRQILDHIDALRGTIEDLRAERDRYQGLWLRGSERHAHEMRAQHEHNQGIIRELTGGKDG